MRKTATNQFKIFSCLAIAMFAFPAMATAGTHVPADELRDMIGELAPQVVEVEREVVVEKEVVREVEVPAQASQTISFGGGLDAQGCAHPEGVDSTRSIRLGYGYESGSLRARGHVEDKPRGSDCTEQGLSIDVAIEQTFDFYGDSFLAVEIGYDEHGVTGFDADDMLVFGSVKQATAAAMIGYEFAGIRAKFGWNVATSQPRFGASYALGEHVELAGDCTGTDGDEPYCDFAATWRRGFGDGWGVAVSFEHSNGLEHLPDPFGGRADAPAANEFNSISFAVERSL